MTMFTFAPEGRSGRVVNWTQNRLDFRQTSVHRPNRNAVSSRRRSNFRIVADASIRSSTSNSGVEESSSQCPMTALGLIKPKEKKEVASTSSNIPIPGPRPLPHDYFQNTADISQILFKGIHGAILAFAQKYGPICR